MTVADRLAESVADPDAISTEVVLSVSEATGIDPTDLDPLYRIVDPDALNQLFKQNGHGPSAGQVVLTMNGCEVTVHADGRVEASLIDDRIGDAPE